MQNYLLPIGLVGMLLLMQFMSSKQRKTQMANRQKQLDSMVVGAYVKTAGGFFGTIQQVGKDYFVLKIDPSETLSKIAQDSVISVVESSEDDDEYEYEDDDDDEEEIYTSDTPDLK